MPESHFINNVSFALLPSGDLAVHVTVFDHDQGLPVFGTIRVDCHTLDDLIPGPASRLMRCIAGGLATNVGRLSSDEYRVLVEDQERSLFAVLRGRVPRSLLRRRARRTYEWHAPGDLPVNTDAAQNTTIWLTDGEGTAPKLCHKALMKGDEVYYTDPEESYIVNNGLYMIEEICGEDDEGFEIFPDTVVLIRSIETARPIECYVRELS